MMIIMMTTNILIFFMKHPMSMGLILIIQTLMVSLVTGMMMKTFWLSYMMIITILSGMMVLFMYMASIASNEKFKNTKKLWLIYLLSNLIMMSFNYYKQGYLTKNTMNYGQFPMKNNDILYMFKMFTTENMLITLMMIMYLFMVMVVVSFIVNTDEGPMRYKYT